MTETDEQRRASLAAVAEKHGAVLLPKVAWTDTEAGSQMTPEQMGARVVALEARVARLEDRRTAGPAVDDNAVREHVRGFLLEATEPTDDVQKATWATELYGWYCAWCVAERKVPVSGIVFLRIARAFKGVSTRRRQVRNKDENRNGIVYMVSPAPSLRERGADVFTQLVPEPDDYTGGPGVMKTIRQKAERRLAHE